MADVPDVGREHADHHQAMPAFRLHHRHAPSECAAAFAAWRGFRSPLRHRTTIGTCRLGGHELWWDVEAESAGAALALLPAYLAERTNAMAVEDVPIP
jgi:hypothetical protein